MQDALLIYLIAANFQRTGCLPDAVKFARSALGQFRGETWKRNPAANRLRYSTHDDLRQEFEAWVDRLTRMETYVLSVK